MSQQILHRQVTADDAVLRERVLNPHREHGRYLRSTDVRSEEEQAR